MVMIKRRCRSRPQVPVAEGGPVGFRRGEPTGLVPLGSGDWGGYGVAYSRSKKKEAGTIDFFGGDGLKTAEVIGYTFSLPACVAAVEILFDKSCLGLPWAEMGGEGWTE